LRRKIDEYFSSIDDAASVAAFKGRKRRDIQERKKELRDITIEARIG